MSEPTQMRVITFGTVPQSVRDLHSMAERGEMDEVRGHRVKFDLDEIADFLPGAIFNEAETVWLIYKKREDK